MLMTMLADLDPDAMDLDAARLALTQCEQSMGAYHEQFASLLGNVARMTMATTSSDTDCTDSGEALSSDPATDCNDASSAINPAATEITGDSVDQNCDSKETCYKDADLDTYGDESLTTTVTSSDSDCSDSGESTTTLATDCNDSSSSIKPSATEITGDGVDQNCDDKETCYKDADLDTYGDKSLST